MTLSLSMLRTPSGIVAETRRVDRDGLALGRGSENDWVLADPDRVLSKRHCAIMRGTGRWQVVDSSSNGTFLNGRCLDPGVSKPLNDGDRLGLGAYEIEIRIAEPPSDLYGSDAEDARLATGNLDRLTGDPFPQQPAEDPDGVRLPHDFNQHGQDGLFGEEVLPAADRVPAFHEHFTPPRVQADLLPIDWDEDWAEPPPSQPAPSDLPPMPGQAIGQGAPPSVDGGSAPLRSAGQPSALRGSDGYAAALMRMFAAAGIEGVPRGTPEDTLDALGRAFRAVVVGLRRIMISRATIKGAFRIEQTMIQATGNNPLKFSADDDDALSALLGVGRRTDMTAEKAIADALGDVRLHDLAVAAAMNQAVREMLGRLAPVAILEALEPAAFDVIPGRRERRAWQAFTARHDGIVRAFTDDLDSVFGKAFVRAYERVQADIAAQDGEPAPRRGDRS